jgi:hypothetical protein
MALGGAAAAVLSGALILAATPAFAPPESRAGGYGSMQTPQPTTSTPMTPTQSSVTQPLSQISDPATKLASASVKDSNGQSVGQVRSVKTMPSGRASSIDVSLMGSSGAGKVVSIDANNLSYDPGRNAVQATLTSAQINLLPATQNP